MPSNAPLIRAAMNATGLSARGLARAIGVNERTMRRWQADEFPVPNPTAALLRVLIATPKAIGVMSYDDK